MTGVEGARRAGRPSGGGGAGGDAGAAGDGARAVAISSGECRSSSGERRSTPGRAGQARGATALPTPAASAPDSYYGRSILKPPIWRWFIPAYFFTGGLAGASAGLAAAAALARHPRLMRTSILVGFAGLAASPLLLIADLGRPSRFYNMLRVVKITSPMSVGTWVLSAFGAALGTAVVAELAGLPRWLRRLALGTAGLLGLPLATYTGALVADTAVPAWHGARRELPFVFAGGAAASAGGLAAACSDPVEAGPARWLAVAGAGAELAAGIAMERRLGPLVAEPYRSGRAQMLTAVSRGASLGGAALLLLAGDRRRPAAVVGGILIASGSLAERFAVQAAGVVSARDPKYVVLPQRERVERRAGRGSVGGRGPG